MQDCVEVLLYDTSSMKIGRLPLFILAFIFSYRECKTARILNMVHQIILFCMILM